MTKKILCLMLCAALILPTCIIPASGLPNTQGYTIEDGVLLAEDFETAPGFAPDASWAGSATPATDSETGNKYYTVRPADDYYSLLSYNAFDNFGLRNTVITFDLRADNPTAPFWVFHRPADPTYALGIGLIAKDTNWYTYRIEIGDYPEGVFLYNSDYIKVYRKPIGAEDSSYTLFQQKGDDSWKGQTNFDYLCRQGWGSGTNMFGFGFRNDRGDALTQAPVYSLDNFAVIKQGKVTSKAAEFVEDGGNVTPVFTTVSGCEASATAITAVYDADGNKVSVEADEVSLSTGIAKVSAPSVDASTVPQGGRVEAMLWDSEDGMQPIAPLSVYGTEGSVDSSDATITDFSVKANEITVEGVFDSNELVTLKAVGGSDIVYATQFKATSDGSFKKVLPINYNGDVTVSVSALGETPQSSSAFAMLDNWADFKDDFKALTAENAEAFFAAYEENFGTLLEVSTLDKETIGYLVSIKDDNDLDDLTYAEILDEVVEIATEGVAAVATFMGNVADARTLYATNEAEAILAMRGLLQNASFADFAKTSDVVCRALLESTETTIQGFWTAYETAKTTQENDEAAQIPGAFAGIADADGMEAFFDTEISISGTPYSIKETLGLTSRLSGYTDKDYAVMDAAYDIVFAAMTDATDYAEVGAAIELLLDYTEEYKVWIEEIATKNTASDEWTSIKKVFGTLTYVTAELADTYFSNETDAYKRIDDMGYGTLAEIATNVSEADARIACLTALNAATTKEAVKTQVELAKTKGLVSISAVSDSEYERMIGFGYNYFEDIVSAYNMAIGPDYQEYGIKDGTGAKELLVSDFVAGNTVNFEELSDTDGSIFYRVTPDNIERYSDTSNSLGVITHKSADAVNYFSPNSIIFLDLRYHEKGMPFVLRTSKPTAYQGTDTASLGIAFFPLDIDVWYTYRIEVGNYGKNTRMADFITIYVKERGADDSTYELLNSVDVGATAVVWNDPTNPNNMDNFGYGSNASWGSAKQVDFGYSAYKCCTNTSWTEDVMNATVTDMGPVINIYENTYIAKSAAFEDSQGNVVNSLPASGTVTPVYTVKNTGEDCWVDAIVVIYDKLGNMVDAEYAVVTVVASEGTEVSGPSIDVSQIPKGGRIEALLVDITDRMRPLSTPLVLGVPSVVEAGTKTELTYSTRVNDITIEGTKEAYDNVVLTVKDMSGNILAATQFATGRKGDFKKTLTINPDKYTSGDKVNVIVSTPAGFVEKEINMSSDWNAMETDLGSAITDAFFTTYEDCFVYYEADGTEKAEITFADAAEKALMTTLINTLIVAETFDDMTSKEIIQKFVDVKKSIDDGKVTDLENAIKNAATKEEVTGLLTSDATKEFVVFNTTGVSNIDAVSQELMNNLAGTENIVQILTKFEAAKGVQQDAEDDLIGSFKHLANEQAMSDFFANGTNRSTFGISKDYSQKDAAVMFNIYNQKNYGTTLDSADAATVVEAIKFVQGYVNEYNDWTDKINNSTTVTAEWNAIKEVFETLEYVSPALVQGNSTEASVAKLYARLSDLGFASLSGLDSVLEDNLSTIEAKAKLLDDITTAANWKEGNSIGRWTLVRDQVVLASTTKGWITLGGNPGTYDDAVYNKMLAKTYRYLSDITTAYNAAVSGGGSLSGTPGGTPGSTPSGGGSGGGGNTSIEINEGKPEQGTNIVINHESHPAAPFADVTAEYSWAEKSISGLRQFGIIRGDGDGNFRPGDGISREEFLALILRVFEIETKATKASFSDVKKNEWYYDTVATAYEMGIVKGYTDGRFGIGDNISRADMAVMVCRTLDIMGVEPVAEEIAYVFTDDVDIPDYAYSATTRLQQMGLINGDSFRRFNPNNNLTRAESAVVLWPIYEDVSGMIK